MSPPSTSNYLLRDLTSRSNMQSYMTWSIDELTEIRTLVGDLLDGIGLSSYVFDVELDETYWVVSVDFPHHDDWAVVNLRVDKSLLRECLKDPEARKKLGSAWKKKLDLPG